MSPWPAILGSAAASAPASSRSRLVRSARETLRDFRGRLFIKYVTLFVAVIYVVANLVVDLVQAALDPRIRLR